MFIRVCLFLLLAAGSLQSQVDSGALPAAVATDMVTPSPVNIEGTSLAFAAETERTNYLWGGVSFASAYDNSLLSATGTALSDVSYSVRPSIAIDESGARLHWNLSYSPGFTFYQRYGSFNESDHDLAVDVRYRLAPHATFILRNTLTKTSALSYHFDPNPIGPGAGILQGPNESVIAPVADAISINTAGQITYQFSVDGMIGASGTETVRHYLHQSQVFGLFNSSTRGAMGFYAHRLSGRNYIGATYQFQQLLSYPNGTETETHGVFAFYTVSVNPTLSLALFGGPQYFALSRPGVSDKLGWSPAGGGTLAWQRVRTSGDLSVAYRVSDGGGLQSSVVSTSAKISIRRQLTRDLTVDLVGNYANNRLVDRRFPGDGGHTVSGSLSLQRTMGEHFSVQLGYTRAHQSYSDIPVIASVPYRNRAWVSVSYDFHRPLGR
jgi:hypothetical protein